MTTSGLPLDMEKPARVAEDLTTIASFLAASDLPELSSSAVASVTGRPRADLLLLLGNAVLPTIEVVAKGMQTGVARRLLIVGGNGHSTVHLREAVREASQYENVVVEGRAEAEILEDLLVNVHGLDDSNILTETESTNCGDNAEHAHALLQKRDLAPQNIILVQDPTMQRRTWASFRRVWGRDGPAQFYNCPPFVPAIRSDGGTLAFEGPDRAGLWTMERFVSLVMGEIPRLRNDTDGYGPRGRGYIVAVDIPASVEAAYQRLRDLGGDLGRSLG
ncbi:YdcF family protein [Salinibacter sp. 10B]|uniref:YdcF family protein n=1 Tax=Salinibacter sp. 10B TaxID=1923971 RepID=UPI001C6157F5|nr:YdcF family protein [Salinibacter sp. 10B]